MKQCFGGNGLNTTAAVQAYLLNNTQPLMKTLYLIGYPEDPYALYLTDYESPVLWSLYGTFQPAVVLRGTVSSKVGLEVTTLEINYSPKIPRTFGVTTATANPMQLAQAGFYDNWPVYVWTVYMSTPGDANTLGCSQLFGGRVSDTTVDRNGIKFQVNSFLDVVNLDVPTNTIEMTNTLASFLGSQPPAGFANVPKFVVSSTPGISPPGLPSTTVIWCDSTNYPGQHWPDNTFAGGFLLFNGGTLTGFWSAIGASHFPTLSAHTYNWFQVYTPFPWAPSAGDTFFASTKLPIDQTDTTEFFGFPYVPDPTQAL